MIDSLFIYTVNADAYLEHLKEELKTVEAESAQITNEIENLSRTQMEGENSLPPI